jgi:DNA-directed RNA polymerase specialized sigma24 family protein
MINKSRTPTVPSQETGGPSATELLEAITPEQEQQLQAFARRRLRRAANTPWLQRHLAPNSAEDLVQEAKAKVLLGEQFPRVGRRLKPRNRVSVEACLACLRGIMESDLSNLLKVARRRGEHLSVGDSRTEPGTVDPPDPLDPAGNLVRRDLRCVGFARLRERAAAEPDLLPVILQWEEGFLTDDRIAAEELNRKPAHRVRVMFREVLQELAAELSVAPVTGKEMLL